MNFAFTEEEEAFRVEVREFLQEALPKEWGVHNVGDQDGEGEGYDFSWAFNRKLANRGWLTVAWPKKYGGQEWSYFKQVVYGEEVTFNQAPRGDSIGPRMVGSLLIGHGTDEQKKRFLPPIASANVRWCQLFSEPNAGSDLAGLETTAEDQGDYFVVNGGKIWSSFAHVADWGFLLARTNKDAPKHQGLSYFLLDMKTAGVTVKPLVSMVGVHRFNQVFFDDVHIPRDCLVGGKDQGWMLSRNVLNVERSGISGAAGSKRMLLDLIAFAQSPESQVCWTSELRSRAADLFVQTEVARSQCYRIAWMQTADVPFKHEASVNKLLQGELSQHIAAFGMELFGLYGMVQRGDRWAPLRGKIERNYKTTIASSIAGGTSEIQRNIIARRGLGLGR